MGSLCIGGSGDVGYDSRVDFSALAHFQLQREGVLCEWAGVKRWDVDCGGGSACRRTDVK